MNKTIWSFIFLTFTVGYNPQAMSMSCEQVLAGLSSLPKSVSQSPKNYPFRNGGKPIKNFLMSEPADPDYHPVEYVSPIVEQNSVPGGWAESPNPQQRTKPFESYEGPVVVDSNGRPLNPKYRTGITNRGNLGKWGANFAADALVTRYNTSSNQFEMLAIQRKDTGEWAIPGGFVDSEENASDAVLRELREETGVDLKSIPGNIVFRGYVDDPRNTDNAWIETTAVLRHLKEPVTFVPTAGDDAANVKWMPLTDENLGKMYASHGEIAKKTRDFLRVP